MSPRRRSPPPHNSSGYFCDGNAAGIDARRVESMLIERNQMKRKKDYDAADQQREDLRRMGVQVDDKTKRWWPSGAPRGRSRSPPRGGGGGGGSSGYRRGDNGSTDVDAKKVEAMLIARLQMKMRRDYDAADQQREEFKKMGVQVNDKRKTWWAGGGGGGVGSSSGPRPLLTRDRSEQDVRGRSPKRQRGSGSPDRSNGSSGNRGDGSRGSDEGGGGAGDDGSKGEEDVEKKKKPPPPPPRSKDVAASKSRSKSPGTPGSESA